MGAEPLPLPDGDKILSLPNTPKPLSQQQKKAIALAATGKTWNEVGVEARISERTLRYWKAQPLFINEYNKARTKYLNDCISQVNLKQLTPAAYQCLQRTMEAGGGPGVKAALAVLGAAGMLAAPEPVPTNTVRVRFGVVEKWEDLSDSGASDRPDAPADRDSERST
jgi:hypothetical protein